MFSQRVEYALRTVVFLASEGQTRTVERIAEVTKIPPAYLAKLVQELVRTGLLSSQRGVGGGIGLTRSAVDLTILDVVNAVDPFRRITTCPLELVAHGVRLCPLHAKMDRVLADAEHAFGTTTVADLLADPNPSVPLCEGPRRLV